MLGMISIFLNLSSLDLWPNKSGRSRESTGEGIPNIDSENDPKS